MNTSCADDQSNGYMAQSEIVLFRSTSLLALVLNDSTINNAQCTTTVERFVKITVRDAYSANLFLYNPDDEFDCIVIVLDLDAVVSTLWDQVDEDSGEVMLMGYCYSRYNEFIKFDVIPTSADAAACLRALEFALGQFCIKGQGFHKRNDSEVKESRNRHIIGRSLETTGVLVRRALRVGGKHTGSIIRFMGRQYTSAVVSLSSDKQGASNTHVTGAGAGPVTEKRVAEIDGENEEIDPKIIEKARSRKAFAEGVHSSARTITSVALYPVRWTGKKVAELVGPSTASISSASYGREQQQQQLQGNDRGTCDNRSGNLVVRRLNRVATETKKGVKTAARSAAYAVSDTVTGLGSGVANIYKGVTEAFTEVGNAVGDSAMHHARERYGSRYAKEVTQLYVDAASDVLLAGHKLTTVVGFGLKGIVVDTVVEGTSMLMDLYDYLVGPVVLQGYMDMVQLPTTKPVRYFVVLRPWSLAFYNTASEFCQKPVKVVTTAMLDTLPLMRIKHKTVPQPAFPVDAAPVMSPAEKDGHASTIVAASISLPISEKLGAGAGDGWNIYGDCSAQQAFCPDDNDHDYGDGGDDDDDDVAEAASDISCSQEAAYQFLDGDGAVDVDVVDSVGVLNHDVSVNDTTSSMSLLLPHTSSKEYHGGDDRSRKDRFRSFFSGFNGGLRSHIELSTVDCSAYLLFPPDEGGALQEWYSELRTACRSRKETMSNRRLIAVETAMQRRAQRLPKKHNLRISVLRFVSILPKARKIAHADQEEELLNENDNDHLEVLPADLPPAVKPQGAVPSAATAVDLDSLYLELFESDECDDDSDEADAADNIFRDASIAASNSAKAVDDDSDDEVFVRLSPAHSQQQQQQCTLSSSSMATAEVNRALDDDVEELLGCGPISSVMSMCLPNSSSSSNNINNSRPQSMRKAMVEESSSSSLSSAFSSSTKAASGAGSQITSKVHSSLTAGTRSVSNATRAARRRVEDFFLTGSMRVSAVPRTANDIALLAEKHTTNYVPLRPVHVQRGMLCDQLVAMHLATFNKQQTTLDGVGVHTGGTLCDGEALPPLPQTTEDVILPSIVDDDGENTSNSSSGSSVRTSIEFYSKVDPHKLTADWTNTTGAGAGRRSGAGAGSASISSPPPPPPSSTSSSSSSSSSFEMGKKCCIYNEWDIEGTLDCNKITFELEVKNASSFSTAYKFGRCSIKLSDVIPMMAENREYNSSCSDTFQANEGRSGEGSGFLSGVAAEAGAGAAAGIESEANTKAADGVPFHTKTQSTSEGLSGHHHWMPVFSFHTDKQIGVLLVHITHELLLAK